MWGVYGNYLATVRGSGDDGRIEQLTLKVYYTDGGDNLPKVAAERAAAAQAR